MLEVIDDCIPHCMQMIY